ncbi:MAG: undecaprenyl-phosphate glucose phosphotransferase, partial [Deltaproteobacteria bacterium]|nr:undecaprenyl-phosphate glucose phosphotransferase [Deltaproteobacteria bacterium]
MLKKHSKLFENLLFIVDIAVISLSWLASYYIRFYSGFVDVTKGIPDFIDYLLLLVPIIVIWAFAFRAFGLYRPKRISTHISEVLDIAKACVIAALLLVALIFF